MTNQHGFSVSKPVSLWNKPLKTDFKGFFQALTKAVGFGAVGNLGHAASEITNALSTIGLGDDPGEIAWVLIYRSLTQAVYTLVEENKELLLQDKDNPTTINYLLGLDPTDPASITNKIDLSLENSKVVISEDFFNQPAELSVIKEFQKPFSQWLMFFSLTEAQAQIIADRLPSYFVYALNDQWRSRTKDYEYLREALNTPFTRASEREQAWFRYSAWLQKQIDERVFHEAFSLRQVYVPPRAYYLEVDQLDSFADELAVAHNLIVGPGLQQTSSEHSQSTVDASPGQDSTIDEKSGRQIERRVVVDLERELETWLDAAETHDFVRVISGGPGSGKSTFAKVFAAHQSLRGKRRVLFIPLHHFELTGDLIQSTRNFLRFERFLTHNPLDPEDGDSNLLVIFDGLDELSMQGKAAAEVAQQFVYEVQKKIYQLNIREPRVKVLISGRELVIQANAYEFRQTHQILTILPYYLNNKSRDERSSEGSLTEPDDDDEAFVNHAESQIRDVRNKTISYKDPDNLLSIDQRDIWWKLYGRATGKNYVAMPKPLKSAALIDITSQPLLGYLVALSFTAGKLNVLRRNNLNAIYGDLLKAIYQRVWAEHQHPTLKGIQEESFIRILEEIAVSAWHGDGRTTTISEIEAQCESSGLRNLLDTFKEGVSKSVARLLLAFYFRQSKYRNVGEQTFEFTHKSFGEYLTSRRIIRIIERIHDELEDHRKSIDKGWEERTALMYWIKLCGPVPIDRYLQNFIVGELSQYSADEVLKWQDTLSRLISVVLSNGMPMELLSPRPSYKEESRQARNAEESLLVVLNACARCTQEISTIKWPTSTTFGTWLSKLQEQKHASEESILLSCLSFLDLGECILDARNLSGADLRHTNFKKASLISANLSGANLEKASFEDAILEGVNLSAAYLIKANLEGANIRGGNLQEIKLDRAFMDAADLEGANLSHAMMDYVLLRQAILRRAILFDVFLRKANLRNSDLDKANLEMANLDKADFKGASLNRASLEKAKCKEINFENAELNGAILEGANLELANLRMAKLEGANLKEATLEKADLTFAYLKKANLELANLEGANLNDAYLAVANLSRSNLTGASLHRANLEDANLESADLQGASLSEASLDRTNLKGTRYSARDLLS